jgi:hypothetical protein
MNMDILLKLRTPGQLTVGENLFDNPLFAKKFRDGQMPWLVLSDLLFTDKREFVGVYMGVHQDNIVVAQKFVAACDPRIVRYFPSAEAVKLRRYQNLLNSPVVELRWSPTEPDCADVAQLMDYWYYDTSHVAAVDYPSAYGYRGIENILSAYNITLPKIHY